MFSISLLQILFHFFSARYFSTGSGKLAPVVSLFVQNKIFMTHVAKRGEKRGDIKNNKQSG